MKTGKHPRSVKGERGCFRVHVPLHSLTPVKPQPTLAPMSHFDGSYPDDGYDDVQYDTFHAPSAGMLEAEEIRRECNAEEAARRAPRRDDVLVTRPY